MNTKISKIFCVITVVAILATFSGCSASRPIKSTEQELKVVGHVGDFDVFYEELRFVVLTYKQSLIETYGENVFEDPKMSQILSDQIREYVYHNITANYAILTMCKEVGIESDSDIIREAVQKKLEDNVRSIGGRRKYIEYLKEGYLTDNFYRFNICVDIMQNELFYVYVDDLALIKSENDYDAISAIIEEEFIRTQHIYISKNNGKTNDENRASVEEAHKRAEAGEEFMTLVSEFGEDPDMSTDGLYIIAGYMDDEYEKNAFSLDINECSDIIETESAFYIIKRLEQDPLYVLWNFSTLCERYQQYTFLNMISETQSYLEFIPNEYFKSLNMLDIK